MLLTVIGPARRRAGRAGSLDIPAASSQPGPRSLLRVLLSTVAAVSVSALARAWPLAVHFRARWLHYQIVPPKTARSMRNRRSESRGPDSAESPAPAGFPAGGSSWVLRTARHQRRSTVGPDLRGKSRSSRADERPARRQLFPAAFTLRRRNFLQRGRETWVSDRPTPDPGRLDHWMPTENRASTSASPEEGFLRTLPRPDGRAGRVGFPSIPAGRPGPVRPRLPNGGEKDVLVEGRRKCCLPGRPGPVARSLLRPDRTVSHHRARASESGGAVRESYDRGLGAVSSSFFFPGEMLAQTRWCPRGRIGVIWIEGHKGNGGTPPSRLGSAADSRGGVETL